MDAIFFLMHGALSRARERTGDHTLSVRCRGGKTQIAGKGDTWTDAFNAADRRDK